MINYEYNAYIKNIKQVNEDIFVFTVAYKDESVKFDFIPGQYTILALEDDNKKWIPRAYSIASAPSANDIEFYIIKVKDGKLTPHLFSLKKGDELYMGDKRIGHMNLNNVKNNSNLILMGTGTGIAPFISMVREYYLYNKAKLTSNTADNNLNINFNNIFLLHGVPYKDNLGYRQELTDLASKESSFHYMPVVSREDWEEGKRGHIDIFLKDKSIENIIGEIKPDNTHIFLCGHPKMIEDNISYFSDLHFSLSTPKESGNIHIEKYF